jgi:hypothetical protein
LFRNGGGRRSEVRIHKHRGSPVFHCAGPHAGRRRRIHGRTAPGRWYIRGPDWPLRPDPRDPEE